MRKESGADEPHVCTASLCQKTPEIACIVHFTSAMIGPSLFDICTIPVNRNGVFASPPIYHPSS